MTNIKKAIAVLNAVDEEQDFLPDNAAYVHALQSKGLLKESPRIIRTQEELEELAREDPDALVLAGEAGVVRTVRELCGLRELVYAWGLPAVIISTGDQVRYAREAMELDNG